MVQLAHLPERICSHALPLATVLKSFHSGLVYSVIEKATSCIQGPCFFILVSLN